MIVSAPTLLAEIVDTSQRVGENSGRRAKIAAIAELLRKLAPAEIEIGVSWLSGETRQGRSGIGYALIRDARPATNVEHAQLTLTGVDATLGAIATTSGPGSVDPAARIRVPQPSRRCPAARTNTTSSTARRGTSWPALDKAPHRMPTRSLVTT